MIVIALIVIIPIISVFIIKWFMNHTKSVEQKYLSLIENINDKMCISPKLKIKSYSTFFDIVKSLEQKYNPRALTIYSYDLNTKLKCVTIKFLYQLMSGKQIYVNGIDGSPISNLEILTKTYENEYFVIDDLNDISKYDSELYEELRNNNIKKLILINYYDIKMIDVDFSQKIKIGFVVLSYNNETSFDMNECILDIQKLAKPVLDIIS